jgi:predicted nucleic acid-binding protein
VTTYLLDTTVFIQFDKGVPAIAEFLAGLRSADRVGTTAVNVGEVFAGTHPADFARWEAYFAQANVWPIVGSAGVWAGERIAELRRRGVQAKLADALVAAVAVSREAVVVTANVRDFVALGVPVHALDREPA